MKASTKLLSMLLIVALCFSLMAASASAEGIVVIGNPDGEAPITESVPAEVTTEKTNEPETPGEPEKEEKTGAEVEKEFVPAENTVAVLNIDSNEPVEYTSLPEALAAAKDDDVVTLVAETVTLSDTLVIRTDVTLDLAWHVLRFDTKGEAEAAILVNNGAKAIVKRGAVTVKGGSDDNGDAYGFAAGVKAAAGSSVSLLDITLNYAYPDGAMLATGTDKSGKSAGSITVIDGEYSSDPSAFIPEGYQAVENEEGMFVVSEIEEGEEEAAAENEEKDPLEATESKEALMNVSETDVAKIGNDGYATLAAALAAAKEDDTIELLKDCGNIAAADVKEAAVIDLAGHNLGKVEIPGGKTLGFTNSGSAGKTGDISVKGGVVLEKVEAGNITVDNSDGNAVLSVLGSDVKTGNISVTANASGGSVIVGITGGSFGTLSFSGDDSKITLTDEADLQAGVAGGTFAGKVPAELADDGMAPTASGYTVAKAELSGAANPYEYYKGDAEAGFNKDLTGSSDAEVTAVSVDTKSLTFTYADGKLTVSKDSNKGTLSSLSAGKHTMTVSFGSRESVDIPVYVYLGATLNKTRYVQKSGEPIVITLTAGDKVDSIVLAEKIEGGAYVNGKTLVEGTDYTVSGDQITLKLDDPVVTAEVDRIVSLQVKYDSSTRVLPRSIKIAPAPSIDPTDTTWKRNADKKFTVKPNVTSVSLGGNALTTSQYTYNTSDNSLVLKADAIKNVAYGTYTLTVGTSDGNVSATVKVAPSVGYVSTNLHTKGGSKNLTFVASDPVKTVKVGTATLTKDQDYTLSSDGKTITLLAKYLNTMSADVEYTLNVTVTANNVDYETSVPFKVISTATAGSTPKTGDESNIGLWIGLMAGAAICAGAVVFFVRRKGKATE